MLTIASMPIIEASPLCLEEAEVEEEEVDTVEEANIT